MKHLAKTRGELLFLHGVSRSKPIKNKSFFDLVQKIFGEKYSKNVDIIVEINKNGNVQSIEDKTLS